MNINSLFFNELFFKGLSKIDLIMFLQLFDALIQKCKKKQNIFCNLNAGRSLKLHK